MNTQRQKSEEKLFSALAELACTNTRVSKQASWSHFLSPFKHHDILELGFFVVQHFVHLKTHRLAGPQRACFGEPPVFDVVHF